MQMKTKMSLLTTIHRVDDDTLLMHHIKNITSSWLFFPTILKMKRRRVWVCVTGTGRSNVHTWRISALKSFKTILQINKTIGSTFCIKDNDQLIYQR